MHTCAIQHHSFANVTRCRIASINTRALQLSAEHCNLTILVVVYKVTFILCSNPFNWTKA